MTFSWKKHLCHNAQEYKELLKYSNAVARSNWDKINTLLWLWANVFCRLLGCYLVISRLLYQNIWRICWLFNFIIGCWLPSICGYEILSIAPDLMKSMKKKLEKNGRKKNFIRFFFQISLFLINHWMYLCIFSILQ